MTVTFSNVAFSHSYEIKPAPMDMFKVTHHDGGGSSSTEVMTFGEMLSFHRMLINGGWDRR